MSELHDLEKAAKRCRQHLRNVRSWGSEWVSVDVRDLALLCVTVEEYVKRKKQAA